MVELQRQDQHNPQPVQMLVGIKALIFPATVTLSGKCGLHLYQARNFMRAAIVKACDALGRSRPTRHVLFAPAKCGSSTTCEGLKMGELDGADWYRKRGRNGKMATR